ncbi:MAG: PKD domain-containing protein, partial [Bacteroidetes bacterium]|nr:PKD domain-containing protein [Bacteroidota bacterium]
MKANRISILFFSFISLFLLASLNSYSQPLRGTYTIGATGSNYNTFNAAVSDLVTNGINGPVIFNIESGSYNQQLNIPSITGSSANNTITFQSSTGNRNDVMISYNAYNYNGVISILAEYIIIKDVSILNTNTGVGPAGIFVEYGSDNNTISNCHIQSTSTNHSSYGVMMDMAANLVLSGNTIIGGGYGIYMPFGGSFPRIENNNISSFTVIGIYNNQIQSPIIIKNHIQSLYAYEGVLLRENYGSNCEISKNDIQLTSSIGLTCGIKIYYNSNSGEIASISNNFITVQGAHECCGISLSNPRNSPMHYPSYYYLYNNSVNINSSNASSKACYIDQNIFQIDVKNNNFVMSDKGYACYFDIPLGAYITGRDFDYNNIYSKNGILGYWSGNKLTINDWQAAAMNFYSSHSISVDPGFVSLTDLHISNPALDRAAVAISGIIDDIDGELRNANTPDIGADEFKVCLNGSFTIGGTGADFQSFNDAVSELTTYGICGPVTFNIASGTYNEQISIPPINGSSAVNTITFQSASGVNTDVILSYTTPSTFVNYSVVQFSGSDYITFEDMTIINYSTYNKSTCFLIEANSDYIIISNNIIQNTLFTGYGSTYCINLEQGPIYNTTIINNSISGGYDGIRISSGGSYCYNPIITGNTITNFIYRGIYANGTFLPVISKNHIESSTAFIGITIRKISAWEGEIAKNTILLNSTVNKGLYGIHIDLHNGSTGYPDKFLFTNNFISLASNGVCNGILLEDGINSSSNPDFRFYNNSISINSTNSASSGFKFETLVSFELINNNIVMSNDGYACYFIPVNWLNSRYSDYNNFYSKNGNVGYLAGNRPDLNDWKSISGNYFNAGDYHSLSVDPLFVSQTDLHINSAIVVGAGTPLPDVSDDIDGDIRDINTPDIGADELIRICLDGTYSIGTASSTYATFNDAVSDLIANGICGPVTFKVASGTYMERITIPAITGASAINTITFTSASSQNTAVILKYNAANHEGVIRLDGADFININNIGITNTYSNLGNSTLVLTNGATNNVILNNIISSPITASFTDAGNIYSTNLLNVNNTIKDNELNGNSRGVYFKGSSANIEYNNTIEGNTIFNFNKYAVQISHQKDLIIKNNSIISNTNTAAKRGLDLQNCSSNLNISANDIQLSNAFNFDCQGMYLYECNGTLTKPVIIVNNFISCDYSNSSGVSTGIYTQSSDYQIIAYNSIHVSSNNATSKGLFIEAWKTLTLKNNISALNNLGISIYMHNGAISANDQIDFNDYYSANGNVGYYNSIQSSLSAWQLATGKDNNSKNVNPNFFSAFDLHIINPILNAAGSPITEISDDIDGEPRDILNPDIGADEYNPCMNGTYTIGGTTADYTTINDAVSDLIAKGVCGHTLFDISPGTYPERVVISSIPGAGSISTITFQSATGVNTDVILTYNIGNDDGVLKFDGADYIIIKHITIKNTFAATNGSAVVIGNNAENNTFSNNIIEAYVTSGSNATYTFNSLFSNNINTTISNNQIVGGERGINVQGYSIWPYVSGLRIENNQVENFSGKGIYIKNNNEAIVKGNTILSNTAKDGIWLDYCTNKNKITRNKIHLSGSNSAVRYGIITSYCSGASSQEGLIANNFVTVENSSNYYIGVSINSSSHQAVYYNSINVLGNNTSSKGIYINNSPNLSIKNNNIVLENYGSCIQFYNMTLPFTNVQLDFNNYYPMNGNVGAVNTNGGATLAQWQAYSSYDYNSICVNPYFNSSTDLHVRYWTLNEAGTPIAGIVDDIDGELRDVNTPDIGADEFKICLNGAYTIGGAGAYYQSLNAAVSDLITYGICGPVTFNITSGTYNEKINIPPINGSSATNTITFQSLTGNQNDVIISYNVNIMPYNGVISINQAEYLIIKDVSIINTNTGVNPAGIFVEYGSDNNSIVNCFIKSTSTNHSSYGVIMDMAANLVLSGNTIIGGGYGIYMPFGGSFPRIENNYISSFTIIGIYTNQIQSAVITQNHIQSLYAYSGILLRENYGSNYEISKNDIQLTSSKGSTFGMKIYYSGSIVGELASITNNFISVQGGHECCGISLINHGNYPMHLSSYYFLYNNSVNINSSNASSKACYIDQNIFQIDVKNNNFVMSDKGYACYFDIPAAAFTGKDFDYNNIYSKNGILGYWSGNRSTINDWQAAATNFYSSHTISIDPGYVSQTNLHINSTNVVGAGTHLLDVTDDIDGDIRDINTPDIGADEYSLQLKIVSAISPILSSGCNTSCFGSIDGSIDLTAVSGVLPLTFLWSNGHTTEDLNGIGAGTYTVIVTDGTNSTVTASVTLTEPSQILSSINIPSIYCLNDPAIIFSQSTSGGSGTYTYLWEFGDGQSSTLDNPNYSYTAAGNYNVKLKITDAFGCFATVANQIEAKICNLPPVALCKSATLYVDQNCQATLIPSDIDGGSYDPDQGQSLSYSLSNSGPFAAGTYHVTLTVTDPL